MYLSSGENSGKPANTKVLSEWKSFLISAGCRGLLARARYLFVDHDGQIDENNHIQDGKHYLEQGEVADDLIKLPGQERPGQDRVKYSAQAFSSTSPVPSIMSRAA